MGKKNTLCWCWWDFGCMAGTPPSRPRVRGARDPPPPGSLCWELPLGGLGDKTWGSPTQSQPAKLVWDTPGQGWGSGNSTGCLVGTWLPITQTSYRINKASLCIPKSNNRQFWQREKHKINVHKTLACAWVKSALALSCDRSARRPLLHI